MFRRNLLLVLLLSAATMACATGQRLSRMPEARTPYGATVSASTTYSYNGELFGVREDGVLVLTKDRRLVFVPFARAEVQAPSLGITTKHRAPDARQFEKLRLSSRHPYGLSEQQLRQVLASLGQAEIQTAR